MATLPPSTSLPLEGDELLLITQPQLRSQLLQARQTNEYCARCVIQRGPNVYLSLREIEDPGQKTEVKWGVVRLQMGALLNPEELPEPLRTILTAVPGKPASPLIQALLWGTLSGVFGGVLVMAIVGLMLTVLNISNESYVGFAATGIAFLLSGTAIGCTTTVYFWRKFTRQQADTTHPLLLQRLQKLPNQFRR